MCQVLDLVVDMMLFHKIFDQVLWEYLLASLMELKQVKILRRCVVALMKTAPDALKVRFHSSQTFFISLCPFRGTVRRLLNRL